MNAHSLRHILLTILATATIALFVIDISVGAVGIKLSDVIASIFGGEVDETTRSIVVDIRLCKALMAIITGIALSVSGQLMQTVFHNPLAGPYVLGISSGASLAVALFLLGAPAIGINLSAASGSMGVAGAAWIGSALVLLMMLIVSRRLKDIMAVLILGIMLSSGIGAIVQILQYASADNALKSFVIWTMGSLGSVTASQLPLIVTATVIGLALAAAVIKPLNLLNLGDDYATTLGVNVVGTRLAVFASTTLLAGTVTAFCGPIGFVGLAMPHVARMIFSTANHRWLLPGAALSGACVMLLCDIISKIFVLPINSLTALVGIPVIIWIVLRNR